jgi:hypothetical protein
MHGTFQTDVGMHITERFLVAKGVHRQSKILESTTNKRVIHVTVNGALHREQQSAMHATKLVFIVARYATEHNSNQTAVY